MKITDDELELIDKIWDGDPIDNLVSMVAPKIVGYYEYKKAVLLSCFSSDDIGSDQNRIHILLFGEKGTGKSKILEWVKNSFQVPKLSHRSTNAGLTGNAIRQGVFSRYPIVCIDEMDKFTKNELDSMLEAMVDGEISLSQANGFKVYPAPVRVIGAANRLYKFSPELLDRFDYICYFREPEQSMKQKIIRARIKNWGEQITYDVPDFWLKLRATIAAKNVAISDHDEISGIICEHFEDSGSSSIRNYEAIIRSAMVISKLRLQDAVTRESVIEAIELHDRITNQLP